MDESRERYLVTSALPYANGPLHVGHMVGAYLPADVFVRYLKARDTTWSTSAVPTSTASP
jgi:methionyl-tRNA synthetase